MKFARPNPRPAEPARPSKSERGSVLIIVMWVAFGLVTLTLYFAHSMSFEMRAAENRAAGIAAEQAIAGAARYLSNILANVEEPGTLPDVLTYRCEAVPVSDATFWIIGRETNNVLTGPTQPRFGLMVEASRLNLNTATRAMLEALPRMTPNLAAAIIDWRDADDTVTEGGAETETYGRLNPGYRCKNASFETVEELRLVFGAELEILYGEDTNLNGVLDANENDGEASPPSDNRDGKLDPGILELVTVSSRESNLRSDGSQKVNVSTGGRQQVAQLLETEFGAERANEILAALGNMQGIQSLIDFYLRSRMTPDEFARIEGDLTAGNAGVPQGLVNVNTASEEVLACLPGIGTTNAPALVAFRLANPSRLNSLAWVTEAIDRGAARTAGPFLTSRAYQFTADVAALGPNGRGYQRVRFHFDTTEEAPKILARQDLTHLGWVLGPNVRNSRLLARNTR